MDIFCRVQRQKAFVSGFVHVARSFHRWARGNVCFDLDWRRILQTRGGLDGEKWSFFASRGRASLCFSYIRVFSCLLCCQAIYKYVALLWAGARAGRVVRSSFSTGVGKRSRTCVFFHFGRPYTMCVRASACVLDHFDAAVSLTDLL